MLDIGWQELLIIGVLAVVVLGPNELPRALRTVTRYVRKARAMASDFQRGVDDMVREAELDDIRKDFDKAADLDLNDTIGKMIDPDGEVRSDLEEAKTALDEVPDPDLDDVPDPDLDDVPAPDLATIPESAESAEPVVPDPVLTAPTPESEKSEQPEAAPEPEPAEEVEPAPAPAVRPPG